MPVPWNDVKFVNMYHYGGYNSIGSTIVAVAKSKLHLRCTIGYYTCRMFGLKECVTLL